jgi:hypothetical protein
MKSNTIAYLCIAASALVGLFVGYSLPQQTQNTSNPKPEIREGSDRNWGLETWGGHTWVLRGHTDDVSGIAHYPECPKCRNKIKDYL